MHDVYQCFERSHVRSRTTKRKSVNNKGKKNGEDSFGRSSRSLKRFEAIQSHTCDNSVVSRRHSFLDAFNKPKLGLDGRSRQENDNVYSKKPIHKVIPQLLTFAITERNEKERIQSNHLAQTSHRYRSASLYPTLDPLARSSNPGEKLLGIQRGIIDKSSHRSRFFRTLLRLGRLDRWTG